MKWRNLSSTFLAAIVLAAAGILPAPWPAPATRQCHAAAITMEMVTVGNAGNTADNTGYGSVAYEYQIGKYEVTNTQYVAFLNAVGTTKVTQYGLYNASGGITLSAGVYAVAASGIGRANAPVSYVSWYDAARFTNWLTTGDTERGVYDTATWAITDHQTAGTTYGTAWFLPSEDEWYKAAYHKNNGVTGGAANYWDYPTGSNTVPAKTKVDNQWTSKASANYDNIVGSVTDVGSYSAWPSTSPYGAFDMAGNVREWNEALIGSSRGARAGNWQSAPTGLLASDRGSGGPSGENNSFGFRVASIPEPGSITLLVCGVLAVLLWWWRRR